MTDDEPTGHELLRAATWIVIVVGLVVFGFAFLVTGGFESCCTRPAPGFTPIPA